METVNSLKEQIKHEDFIQSLDDDLIVFEKELIASCIINNILYNIDHIKYKFTLNKINISSMILKHM